MAFAQLNCIKIDISGGCRNEPDDEMILWKVKEHNPDLADRRILCHRLHIIHTSSTILPQSADNHKTRG